MSRASHLSFCTHLDVLKRSNPLSLDLVKLFPVKQDNICMLRTGHPIVDPYPIRFDVGRSNLKCIPCEVKIHIFFTSQEVDTHFFPSVYKFCQCEISMLLAALLPSYRINMLKCIYKFLDTRVWPK